MFKNNFRNNFKEFFFLSRKGRLKFCLAKIFDIKKTLLVFAWSALFPLIFVCCSNNGNALQQNQTAVDFFQKNFSENSFPIFLRNWANVEKFFPKKQKRNIKKKSPSEQVFSLPLQSFFLCPLPNIHRYKNMIVQQQRQRQKTLQKKGRQLCEMIPFCR